MDRPRFVIEASEAESMAKNSGLTLPQLLPTLVKSAQSLALPPISNFHVGAVGLGSDGRIFLGVNLEFPGLPLHHSVHAEQFLITNLAIHNSPRLLYFAVSDAPCGHCRQFFQELRHASQTQFLVIDKSRENADFQPLSSLLPNPFGPFDLLDSETPLILEKHDNGLTLLSENESFCPDNGHLSNGVTESFVKNELALKIEALEGANSSHSPYSGCPSGVALMDSEGNIYKGSYMESAAYNPSLGPVQAALVAYVAAGGGSGDGYSRIVAAVLVEKQGVAVRQEDTARLLLKMVSPKCEFRIFHCVSASVGCKTSTT